MKSLDDAPFFNFGGDRLDAARHLDEMRSQSWLLRTAGGGLLVVGRHHVQALLADGRLGSPVSAFIEMQGVTTGLLH